MSTPNDNEVTRADAVQFLECAVRNWRSVSRLSNDDVDDVARALQQFLIRRTANKWAVASSAPDGVDVLVWRQDSHRADNLYGLREVAMFDIETSEWFDGNGQEIGGVRFWSALQDKPTAAEIHALSSSSSTVEDL